MNQNNQRKLIRLTTVDLSLYKLLKGQLKFVNQYYHVIGVASDTGLLDAVAKREGVSVIDVPMHREISLMADVKSLFDLYRLFKVEQPYIVHVNTPKGSLLGMIAAWAAHVPHRVYTVTGLRYQGAKGFFRFILKTMERVSCFFATNVIPEGQGVLQTLQTDHITNKPLRVLHYGNINGIDTDFFRPMELDHSNDLFTFVFIGRIVRDKGIHELTACMRRLDCRLLLVGSFEDGDPIDEEDKRFLLSSEKVKYVGWQDDIRPFLAQSDALVFPSYREGFPNVPIQAGSMERASIVTNINGCNEIVVDGLTGRIVDAHNEESLLSTMNWFIHHPVEVKRMGKAARDLVKERFEQKDLWHALLDYYDSLDCQ